MSLHSWILFTVFAVGLSTSEEALLQAALEVAGDDECLEGREGDCAVNALQIRASRRFGVSSSSSFSSGGGGAAGGNGRDVSDKEDSSMDSAGTLESEREGLAAAAAAREESAAGAAGSAAPEAERASASSPSSSSSTSSASSASTGKEEIEEGAGEEAAAGEEEASEEGAGEEDVRDAPTEAAGASDGAPEAADAPEGAEAAPAAAREDSAAEAGQNATMPPAPVGAADDQSPSPRAADEARQEEQEEQPGAKKEARPEEQAERLENPSSAEDDGVAAQAEAEDDSDSSPVESSADGEEAEPGAPEGPRSKEGANPDGPRRARASPEPPHSGPRPGSEEDRKSAYGQFPDVDPQGSWDRQGGYGRFPDSEADIDWQEMSAEYPDVGDQRQSVYGQFPEEEGRGGAYQHNYGDSAGHRRHSAYGEFPEGDRASDRHEESGSSSSSSSRTPPEDEAPRSGPPPDEDDGGGFANHKFRRALRIPGSIQRRAQGGPVKEPSSEEGGRQRGDKHELNFIDSKDYRQDAVDFLKEALEKDPTGSAHCDLTEMNYSTVVDLWTTFRDEWMAKIPADTPHGARLIFLSRVREAFPELLFQGNPVVVRNATEALGWDVNAWNQENISKVLGNLSLQEMSFGYPIWLGNSVEEGRGSNADGSSLKTTFEQYFKTNKSAEDIFLFLNEEIPGKEPRLELESENEAVRRIRNFFTPTPPFAWPAKNRLALVAIDGRGSSHGFHEHTAVWQVQVQGYKMWHFMPPSTPMSKGRHKRGGSPMVKGQPWEHPNGCAFLKKVPVPPGTTQCLVGPGSMVIMPANWVHSTCGLDQYTVGLGGWLHGQPYYRGGDTMDYLQWSLKDLYKEAARGWTLGDEGIDFIPDQAEEILAGLSREKAALDREAHPLDYENF